MKRTRQNKYEKTKDVETQKFDFKISNLTHEQQKANSTKIIRQKLVHG